ncbi:MAG: amidophosphoribosyltransferase [Actinomycetota bacterium]|nr:amidophosphoribosyltransferase [Actinomycetota bacterium]
MKEECGVFGIHAPGKEVGKMTYFGLYALQHRGQESAGIAVTSGDGIIVVKDLGLVSQVFNENSFVNLRGDSAIGHVRYSTTGSNSWKDAQPLYEMTERGPCAIAQNSNLVNTIELRGYLEEENLDLTSTTDTEVMSGLLRSSKAKTTLQAIEDVFPAMKGAYSIVLLTEEGLYGIRDPYGIRPLCIGTGKETALIASESPALDVVGARMLREVEPGEVVRISESGIEAKRFAPSPRSALCIFEFIYFARPDTILQDRLVYDVRKRMGFHMAENDNITADMVIPVPDSGIPAAVGYAERAGIPFGEGLIKNRYIGRTFIQPTQEMRNLGVRLKLNALAPSIAGKRLVVVDDSIVRGTTSRKIVELLREGGAREVHMRISSPPIRYPCFYGIDTANRDELIASNLEVDQIKDFLGVDSLSYMGMDDLISSCGEREKFCTACFDGAYPIEVPRELEISKFKLEKTREGM